MHHADETCSTRSELAARKSSRRSNSVETVQHEAEIQDFRGVACATPPPSVARFKKFTHAREMDSDDVFALSGKQSAKSGARRSRVHSNHESAHSNHESSAGGGGGEAIAPTFRKTRHTMLDGELVEFSAAVAVATANSLLSNRRCRRGLETGCERSLVACRGASPSDTRSPERTVVWRQLFSSRKSDRVERAMREKELVPTYSYSRYSSNTVHPAPPHTPIH